jgi:hypothetical protein
LSRPFPTRTPPKSYAGLRPLRALAAIGVAAALLAGCGRDGSTGDTPATPLASVCGRDLHVSSKLSKPCTSGSDCPTGICPESGTCSGFFGPAPWYQASNVNSDNCPYPVTQTVHTTCLTVTAVDRWDETGNGAVGTVYVQDTVSPTPQYGAISLFAPSFNPPDLRVLPGDVIDVTGSYEEFQGPSSSIFQYCATLPQIGGAAAFRFDGEVPAPIEITPADLNSYENARRYLNMLVTVKGVTIAANGASSSGRYSAAVSVAGTPWSIDDELFDVGSQMPLTQGETFDSVTGIVTYFFAFHLAPRSAADFHKTGS